MYIVYRIKELQRNIYMTKIYRCSIFHYFPNNSEQLKKKRELKYDLKT